MRPPRAARAPSARTASAAPSVMRCHLDRGGEHVALAAHRLDDCRLLGVFVEPVAQAAYLDVDAAVERRRIAREHEIDQLVAVQHAVRVREEDSQQLEFGAAQRDDHARGRQQVARRDVERPAGETDPARGFGLQVVGQRARAAQHALDAREQLARAERLGR